MKFKPLFIRFLNILKDNWKHVVFIFSISLLSYRLLEFTDFTPPVYLVVTAFLATVISGRFIQKRRIIKYILLCTSVAIYLGTVQYYMLSFIQLVRVAFHFILLYSFLFPDMLFSTLTTIIIIYSFSLYGLEEPTIRNTVIGLITQGSAFIALSALLRSQEKDRAKLKQLNNTDLLTGVASLGYIMEQGKRYIKEEQTLTTIVIDLNNFKQINDTYGHATGNNVLIQVANFLKDQAVAIKGIVGRLGGDEFVILAKKRTMKEIEAFCASLQSEINERTFTLDPDISPMKLSFAVGKATSTSLHNQSITVENLLYNADIDMYYNKYSSARNNLNSGSDNYNFPAKVHHLLNVLAEKDMYTYVHSEHTAHYSVLIGKHMGLPEETLNHLFIAGWLHDIGKILISNNILRKPGKLNEGEYQIIQDHPSTALDILSKYSLPQEITAAIHYHHEKWSGEGYPERLKEVDIPITARILKVADAYSAMIIRRLYRKSLTNKQALKELEKNTGIEFDPEIVMIVKQLHEKENSWNIDKIVKDWLDEMNLSIQDLSVSFAEVGTK